MTTTQKITNYPMVDGYGTVTPPWRRYLESVITVTKQGGTGLGDVQPYGMLIAGADNTQPYQFLPYGTVGQYLSSQGESKAPQWLDIPNPFPTSGNDGDYLAKLGTETKWTPVPSPDILTNSAKLVLGSDQSISDGIATILIDISVININNTFDPTVGTVIPLIAGTYFVSISMRFDLTGPSAPQTVAIGLQVNASIQSIKQFTAPVQGIFDFSHSDLVTCDGTNTKISIVGGQASGSAINIVSGYTYLNLYRVSQ